MRYTEQLFWLVRSGVASQPVGNPTDHLNPKVGDLVYRTGAGFEKQGDFDVVQKGELVAQYIEGRFGPCFRLK